MAGWIGAIILALALMFGGLTAVATAALCRVGRYSTKAASAGKTSDLGARRRIRHHARYVYLRVWSNPTY